MKSIVMSSVTPLVAYHSVVNSRLVLALPPPLVVWPSSSASSSLPEPVPSSAAAAFELRKRTMRPVLTSLRMNVRIAIDRSSPSIEWNFSYVANLLTMKTITVLIAETANAAA